MDNSFQRTGSTSNTHVGRDFELAAQKFFADQGVPLKLNFKVSVGIKDLKKDHAFDLGSDEPKIIIECKSHTWTAGGNVPSAKMTVWNEAMYYFHVTQPDYRKIMFVLKDMSNKRNETLAEYYIRTYRHLIPDDVEIWEYDETPGYAERLSK